MIMKNRTLITASQSAAFISLLLDSISNFFVQFLLKVNLLFSKFLLILFRF